MLAHQSAFAAFGVRVAVVIVVETVATATTSDAFDRGVIHTAQSFFVAGVGGATVAVIAYHWSTAGTCSVVAGAAVSAVATLTTALAVLRVVGRVVASVGALIASADLTSTGCTSTRFEAGAGAGLTHVGYSTVLAVVASGAILFGWIAACPCVWVADTNVVTLVGRSANYRCS